MKKHLAIDMGSESGRAIVGFLENGKLQSEEIYRFKTQFMQMRGHSVRNLYRFNDEIQNALTVYAQKYGPDLYSISVDAWGGDFVILNRDGNFNHLPGSYRETSTIADTQEIIESKFGERRLYERNGNQRLPQDPLRVMLRMKMRNDPALDDPHGILFVADAMEYLLGAEPCCERSMPTFCRMYNFREDRWDDEVFDAFDLPKGIYSKVVSPGVEIGQVDPQILRKAGLNAPVRIITSCSHDTGCAVMSVANLDEDWAFISCGTWALMGIETDKPVINDIAYENNFNNSTIPLHTNMFKRNVTGTWIIQQCKEAWNKYSYNDIVDLAERAEDVDYSIDINALEFYSPNDMPAAIINALKCDFDVDIAYDDVGTISRIVFQSMVLKYKMYIMNLQRAANREIHKIYMLGGGSRNRLLNQFTANACGYPVFTGVYEASSTGNLLLQMYGSGELSDKRAMRQVVINSFPQHKYVPEKSDAWKRKYDIYLERSVKKNQW